MLNKIYETREIQDREGSKFGSVSLLFEQSIKKQLAMGGGKNTFGIFRVLRLSLILVLMITGFYANSQKAVYFQQKVDYKIDVSFDDVNRLIRGIEIITYKNNSPDTLTELFMHFYPRAYSKESTALGRQKSLTTLDFYFTPEDERGNMDSLNFLMDGQMLEMEFDKQNIDIGKLKPSKPILPGQTVAISTSFRVKIPYGGQSRMGCDSTSFQVSQWFPKMAVYDASGWHAMPYLEKGEFYSDFGDYDVTITLPEKYLVAATGELVTESEVKYLAQVESITSKSKSGNNRVNQKINSNKLKTIRFVQENVHDFAWFADINFRIRKGTAKLKSGKEVETYLFYPPNPNFFVSELLTTINRTIVFYSDQVGEYPHKTCSVVIGGLEAGSGMEYPTICIISKDMFGSQLHSTVAHEIGHNWFYGIFGFNERDFPWLDEGLNTFYQFLWETKFQNKTKIYEMFGIPQNTKIMGIEKTGLLSETRLEVAFSESRNILQAANLNSVEYSYINYALSVYYKPALSFIWLRDYLGHDFFDQIMRDFYVEWANKHPQPQDFINFFTQKSGKNLSWFFDGVLGSIGRVDYKISSVKKVDNSDKKVVYMKNVGDIASPFMLTLVKKSGVEIKTRIEGFEGTSSIEVEDDVVQVVIDKEEHTLDFNTNNNYANTRGIFKTSTPVDLAFLYHLPTPNKRFIFLSPLFGWNYYNKSMLGIAFYNDPVLDKKFGFQLMPLYSFARKNLNGEASVQLNFFPKKIVRKITFALAAKKFDFRFESDSNIGDFLPETENFIRLSPELRFYFMRSNKKITVDNILRIRYLAISKQDWQIAMVDNENVAEQIIDSYWLTEMTYKHTNKRKVNPLDFEIKSQLNDEVVKISATANFVFNYNKTKKLDIRFFGGYIAKNISSSINYTFSTSSFDGMDDYVFDNTYLARSSSISGTFLASQTYQSEGGFMLPTFIGRGQTWLFAANLKTSIPKTKYIKLFANTSIYDRHPLLNHSMFLYEGGFVLQLYKEYFEVYFPVVWSKDIQDVFELNNLDGYNHKIRFVLRFDLLNPFRYLQDISL